jgi:type IV pilus assembly protein PilP
MQFISTFKTLFLVVLIFSGLLCSSAWSLDTIDDPADRLTGSETGGAAAFEYKLDDRPDPFVPFISKDKPDPAEISDEIVDDTSEVLTGMRLFEPGQLTLVAVMALQGRNIAMVQDVTGRGYILNEGMLIGRHGIVTRIDDDQVLVTNTTHTRANRTITKEIHMRLKNEGER